MLTQRTTHHGVADDLRTRSRLGIIAGRSKAPPVHAGASTGEPD
ncbi:MAG: hypothetical protein ACLTMP_14500 [Eggerthella lenta]